MERRDFFGVIAAALLRRETPPVPMARTISGFVPIKGVQSIGIRSTAHVDHWRKKIATLMDAGDISFTVNFDPAEENR